jgi:dienelactone hydrolase
MTHEQAHPSQSPYDASFVRVAAIDHPDLNGREVFGKEVPVEVDLRVYPSSNGVIVINYPGAGDDIDGHMGRYQGEGYSHQFAVLGENLQRKVGAVLMTDNNLRYAGFSQEEYLKAHLRAVIGYALEHSEEIAGQPQDTTSLYLMGHSAGAGTIAAVAHESPQVRKILLLAPARNVGSEAIVQGLGSYTGECYTVVGENDEMLDTVRELAALATSASVSRTLVVPDCNHYFEGERNSRIIDEAPLWAFGAPVHDSFFEG